MSIMKKATRDGFGEAIVEMGKENPNVYVVDIDIGKSCKTVDFRKTLPEQYLNVGIAEQNGAGVAAGLATCGKIPYVVTYAAFGSMRICEMIRQEICYPNLNVKIACSHGGVTPANDGASHQCIEDLGILRTLPNMTVIMPADYYAAKALVKASADYYGPVYLRFTRDAIPVIYDENATFTIGKANLLRDGKDVALIANGDTVRLALEAADLLAAEGITARVLDMHTIKPLDVDSVNACINEIGKIITIEDHNIYNGLGWVHVDVMDGVFVPNITIGITVVRDIRRVTSLPLDVHLMIDRPIRYAEHFIKAGADWLTIHLEADTPENTMACLEKIRSLGCKAGLSLKPGTPAEAAIPYLTKCDMILVMTVEPGFGGQSFMADMMAKTSHLRSLLDEINPECLIEVDGGIDTVTQAVCKENGVEVMVTGSAYFKAPNRAEFVRAVQK